MHQSERCLHYTAPVTGGAHGYSPASGLKCFSSPYTDSSTEHDCSSRGQVGAMASAETAVDGGAGGASGGAGGPSGDDAGKGGGSGSQVGCSFALSGENLVKQELWQCFTCALTFETGACCCVGCALTCHDGHEVAPAVTARAYCDCGAKACDLLASGAAARGAAVHSKLADVGMDDEGRINGTSDAGLDFAFGSVPGAVARSALEELRRQAETLVSASKETFWHPMGAAPRTPLESLAAQMFKAHTAGLDASRIDATMSGAEFWVQYKPASSWATQEGGGGDGAGIGCHFDKDEELAEAYRLGVYPALSTVTYLDEAERGGPPTVVLDRVAGADDDDMILRAWISHPRPGKHIVFDGRLLHGVPPVPELRELEAEPALRVTFLVNVWLNHRPARVERLSDATVSALNARWGAGAEAECSVEFSATARTPPLQHEASEADVADETLAEAVLPFLEDDDGEATLVVRINAPTAKFYAAERDVDGALDDSTVALVYEAAVAAALDYVGEYDDSDEESERVDGEADDADGTS